MASKKRNSDEIEPKIGHNSNLNADDQRKLAGYVKEIESVEAEIKVLNSDRGEIYKGLKESGFDTAAIKHVIKMRKMDRVAHDELENSIAAYMQALGMLSDTPLGAAAISRDLSPKSLSDTAEVPFALPTD